MPHTEIMGSWWWTSGLDEVDDFEDVSGVTHVSPNAAVQPKLPLAASLSLASFQPVYASSPLLRSLP